MALPRLIGCLLACAAIGCPRAPSDSAAAPRGDRPPRLQYRVAVDLDGGGLRTELCFPDGSPHQVGPVIDGGSDLLRWAVGPGGRPLARDQNARLLPDAGAPGCIQYSVDLDLARRTSRHVGRYGSDLAASSGLWLWRPEPLHPKTQATVRFEAPEGVRVLTPWPRAGGVHRLDPTALRRHAYVAFGRFPLRTIRVHGVDLTYARLGDATDDPSDETVRRWLGSAVDAVARVHGRFPAERMGVVIRPAPPGSDPVASGMVQRGGGISMTLLLRSGAERDELVRDWVAVHEMCHLLIPSLARRDAWLSEGLATYYQNVARARAGLISPLEAWREMEAGFERGRRGGTGRPLRDESARMHRTFAFRRVYWAGTAFALEADLTLRITHGTSLDAVLAELAVPHGGRHRVWSAEELLAKMDAVAGTRAISELAERYLQRSDFPDTDALFQRVGLARDPSGDLVPDEGAPRTDLRRGIMRGPPPGTESLVESGATELSAFER